MTLEQRVETLNMKKYRLTVKSICLADETVSVVVNIYYSKMVLMPLFNINIDLEREENASISSYESLAIKKAASLIHNISEELSATA